MSITQTYNLLRLSVRHRRITLKKIGHFIDKWRSRKNEFPTLVRFSLFYGCNLRCTMCGQWGVSGNAEAKYIKDFMPLEKLREIVDEAALHRPEIYVWGGEPTLHPDFGEFITYVKKKNLICTINTNGVLLERFSDMFIESHVDSLDVSLMGDRDVHDRIVQVSGTFDRVIRGLETIHEKGKGDRPLVKVIITLNSYNVDAIEPLLDRIEQHPAFDMSIIQLGWFVPQHQGEIYRERMRNEFGINAVSWRGFRDDTVQEKAMATMQLIRRIREKGRYGKPILLFPDIETDAIHSYYTQYENRLGQTKCWALYRELDIRHNGDVVVCADFPDLVVGTVLRQKLEEIWQGEILNDLRRSIAERGPLSICNRCCGFFR
ncbi:MAG: radical SAM protein [Syntrophales bacterium]|nr:radical SAM protein [Syntrophales bacterium]